MGIKKGLLKLFFIVFLIMFLFAFINNAGAKGLTGKEISEDIAGVDVEGMTEKITNIGDVLTDKEARSEFLKKEWVEFLSGTKAGKFLMVIDGFLVKLNPVFKTLLGLEWKFSWVFILTFVLWFLFIDYSYAISKFFEPYSEYGKAIKWGVFLACFVFFSSVRISKLLATWVVKLVSGDMHWAWQVVLIAIIVGVLILLFTFKDKIIAFLNMLKEKARLERIEEWFKKEKEEKKKLEKDVKKGKYESPASQKKSMEEEAKEEAKADLEGAGDEINKDDW